MGDPFVVIDTILIVAENVAVVIIVVIHEQVAGVSVVVEVIGEMPHQLFEVIAVVYDFSCEVFLAVVLTDVAVLEMFKFFTAPVDEGVHSVRRILVAQVAVFQRVWSEARWYSWSDTGAHEGFQAPMAMSPLGYFMEPL